MNWQKCLYSSLWPFTKLVKLVVFPCVEMTCGAGWETVHMLLTQVHIAVWFRNCLIVTYHVPVRKYANIALSLLVNCHWLSPSSSAPDSIFASTGISALLGCWWLSTSSSHHLCHWRWLSIRTTKMRDLETASIMAVGLLLSSIPWLPQLKLKGSSFPVCWN